MGKRKRTRSNDSNNYKYICRKLKKLERKIHKYRRRSSSSSTDLSDQRDNSQNYQNYYYDLEMDGEYRNRTDEEALQEDVVLQNISVPVEETQNARTSEETPASGPSGEPEEALDPEILVMLGEDPTSQKTYSDDLHKDIAARWAHILCNGLPEECKSDLMTQYLPAKNCIHMKAPKLNLEIKAALSPINIKKDLFCQYKQNQLSSCLSAIGKCLNWALSTTDILPQAQEIIKPLSDAGRLLSDCHFRESQSRRYAVIKNLNKQTKDVVKNTKIDEFLFGTSLAEHLRSSQAISKSGLEMKSTIQRPSSRPLQNQRGALRGTSRAAAFELRHNPTPRRQAPAPLDYRQEFNRRNNSARRGART